MDPSFPQQQQQYLQQQLLQQQHFQQQQQYQQQQMQQLHLQQLQQPPQPGGAYAAPHAQGGSFAYPPAPLPASLPPPPLPPPEASPLGLLIPGRPITTAFAKTSPTQYCITIPAPGGVQELAVFLVPGQALPPGYGLAFFFSLPPFTEWSALGTTSPASPSGMFRTGWPSTPAVAAAPEVRLAVSLETGDTVSNLQAATGAGTDKGIAQLLAEDLVTCLGSYAQAVPGVGERIVLPPEALPMWLRRVQEKTRSDPNLLFLRKEQKR